MAKKKNSSQKEGAAFSIKLKLFIGFAIPLICMVIVGIGAYSKAASGMIYNYEESTSKALSMAMEYLNFGFESAVSESEQLYYDNNLVKWATNAIYNEWTKKEIAETAARDLSVKKDGNEFISNMYIIPGKNMSMVSAYSDDKEIAGFYDDLAEEKEAECLQTLEGKWVGSHDYIDSVLSENYADYSADSYACSYIRPMTTKRACIVVDYSSESIAGILRDLNLGDESISAFIMPDGRELLLNGDDVVRNSEFSFVDQAYYQDAMAENAEIVIDYVPYQGEQYLFMASKSSHNSAAVCAMVPVSMVNAQADSIQHITVIMVFISCVIAIFAGILITAGIVRTIKQISGRLEVVSGGDLTVEVNEKRHDEFKILVKGISDMIQNSRKLIIQVMKTAENVNDSAKKLTEASEVLTSSNTQISVAVDEMDEGLNQQSQDSQDCVILMEELSNRITSAVDLAKKMGGITGNAKAILADGMSIMDDLTRKSSDTTEVTRKVTSNIKNLEDSLSEIETFVATINNVAEETSLLALNASIEAARAGDAGRGFAVVAQSVSQLSDGTIEAADQIQNVMEQIKEYANDTVRVAAAAEGIVSKQSETVKDTIHVFGDINGYLERLMEEITALETTIKNMEGYRNDTLSAIASISAVSEEMAASFSTVNESLKRQLGMVDDLHESTVDLEDKASVLTEAVNAFKL